MEDAEPDITEIMEKEEKEEPEKKKDTGETAADAFLAGKRAEIFRLKRR